MKLVKATAAALLAATATLAVAQTTTEQSFAEQFKNMQSLQSFGTYTFKPAPGLGAKPSHPMGNQSFTDNFADMQAQSSNSDEWKAPAGEGQPAYATSNTTTTPPSAPASTAQGAPAPTAIERLTHAVHAPSGSSSQSN